MPPGRAAPWAVLFFPMPGAAPSSPQRALRSARLCRCGITAPWKGRSAQHSQPRPYRERDSLLRRICARKTAKEVAGLAVGSNLCFSYSPAARGLFLSAEPPTKCIYRGRKQKCTPLARRPALRCGILCTGVCAWRRKGIGCSGVFFFLGVVCDSHAQHLFFLWERVPSFGKTVWPLDLGC
jgi:hypothetical protein